MHCVWVTELGFLEAALMVTPGDGYWQAHADPAYEAANGMFGGWTTAIALAGIRAASETGHEPSAITVNFLRAVPPGSEVRVHVDRLGGTRSISHWAAQVNMADEEDVFASVTAVLASRRPSDQHLQATKPEVPDPEGLEVFHPPDPAGERSDILPISGHLPYGKMDTRSLSWIREMSGRAVDRLQLAFLADQCAPRSFFWSDGPRPSATLTMTVYFHATDDELAAVGDDYVLHEATATRGVASTADQQVRLWSRSGVLLATSDQLTWYR